MSSGHFWQFGNRNNPVSSRESALGTYKNLLKHAIIFHPRIVLADHMIANSPNFLRCLADGTASDLLRPEYFSIAYIEPEINRSTGEIKLRSLQNLRQFYRKYRLLDASIPSAFLKPEFDERVAGAASFAQPIFTTNVTGYDREHKLVEYFLNYLKSPAFALSLENSGPSASAPTDLVVTQIERALYECEKQYGPIGIIHLDPNHRDPDEKTIYEIIKEFPGVLDESLHPVHNARWINEVARVSRCLLHRAESSVAQLAPILTPAESPYVGLYSSSVTQVKLSELPNVRIEIPLHSACLSHEGMSALSGADLLRLRETEEGQSYFTLLGQLELGESILIGKIEETTKGYIDAIDRYVFDRYNALRRTGDVDFSAVGVRISIQRWHSSIKDNARLNTIVGVVTALANAFTFNTASPIVAAAEEALAGQRELNQYVTAKHLVADDAKLTCYSSIGKAT